MATGSSVSCISEDLTCAVCLDLFTNPRVLRCMHTYCHECMVGLVQTGNRSQQWKKRWTSFIVCPECRQNTNLDNRGVLGLAVNFALSKVVETYRNAQQAPRPSNVPCSLCEDTSKFAVKTCLDCPKISYCDGCLSLFHPPRGVLKTHRLVAPSATDDPSSNNSKTTTCRCLRMQISLIYAMVHLI
ncbi:probable E3 ubiquitin-protein ligase MID2 [Gigantopelta aegis]|uniref:probable E3 ubiquitin-protein ligase MID2 n=1 Tax=Gigantopelta aegis TaxID=1735272 RepID=UPI001B88A5DF|nr:probable E3 ubiquitin-protein ligase MID2 [Gigantopelta aegis]